MIYTLLFLKKVYDVFCGLSVFVGYGIQEREIRVAETLNGGAR